jgi:hypothetical protein
VRAQAKTAKVRTLSGAGVDRGFSVQPAAGPRIDVALAGDKFVVAVGGAKAIADAVKPAATLGDAPAFKAAAGRLGDGIRPSFFLDMSRLAALVGTTASGSAGYARARPYLDAFAALVAGAKDEGSGVLRARFAVTLK